MKSALKIRKDNLFMKRKNILAAAAALLLCVPLTACGNSSDGTASSSATTASAAATAEAIVSPDQVTEDTDTSNRALEASEYDSFYQMTAAVYKKYVTLPEYKGIAVTVDRSSEDVSDDTVEETIQSMLEDSASTVDVTADGVTQSGDTITLDYQGLLDGVAFDGGTATDQTYTIGSGKFISDLDEGLVGLKANVQTDIPCTFPDDYSSSDLASKSVIFRVTIKSITRKDVPELTDAWVQANAANYNYTDETTADQFRQAVKEELVSQKVASNDSTKFKDILATIADGLTVDKYPEKELTSLTNTMVNNVKTQYQNYGASSGYTSFDGYLQGMYGMENEAAFTDYASTYAQNYLLTKMIVTEIADAEDIHVTEEEINDLGESLASYYGYDGYDTIISSLGKEMNCEVGYEYLYGKVEEVVNAAAVETTTNG